MSERMIELVQGETGFELPFENGNWVLLKETGYSPVEILVASIGGCGAYVYKSILTKSKIPHTFQRSEIHYSRDERKKTAPLKTVKIDFYVEVPTEYQARAQRGLKLIAANCPVIQSIDPKIQVSEQIYFV